MTQKETVLQHLKEFGAITPMKAFRNYGITRLGGIVYFLRKDGHKINTEIVKTKSNGKTCYVAKYTLETK